MNEVILTVLQNELVAEASRLMKLVRKPKLASCKLVLEFA